MSQQQNLDHQSVDQFAELMKAKLDLRSSKPGNEPGGWRGLVDPPRIHVPAAMWVLYERCQEELAELRDAIMDSVGPAHDYPDAIISECCDVANFAMMVADLARTLPERLPETSHRSGR